MSLNYNLFKNEGQLTVTEAAKKYGIQNRTTVVQWLRKFGNFDWENTIYYVKVTRR
jgi:transposase-like protein